MKSITVSFPVSEGENPQLYMQEHSVQDDLWPNQCCKAEYLLAYSDLYIKKKKNPT